MGLPTELSWALFPIYILYGFHYHAWDEHFQNLILAKTNMSIKPVIQLPTGIYSIHHTYLKLNI